MEHIIEFNSRKLVLHGLYLSQDIVALLSSGKFLTMLPAYSEKEVDLAMQIAGYLIDSGCIEICGVGLYSSRLHDQIDSLLEDREELSVVTTSFNDEIEASEYFIFAADGAEARLLIALVGEHTGVVNQLRKMAINTIKSPE